LLSNAKTVSYLILTVAGSRSSPNTMACPVAMHSCQPSQSDPPNASALVVCHGRSIRPSQNQNTQSFICSHSGGPPGIVVYHSLLGTQIVQCTPTPEDHSVLILTPHSWDSHALLFLVISLSRHLFTWARTVDSRLPRTRIIFTWSLLLVAATTYCQFIRFILVDHCQFSRLPRTIDSYRSSGPCGIHHTVAYSRGLLPRTFAQLIRLLHRNIARSGLL
jgi:hypothetical protein